MITDKALIFIVLFVLLIISILVGKVVLSSYHGQPERIERAGENPAI
jgi:hypothetical protein